MSRPTALALLILAASLITLTITSVEGQRPSTPAPDAVLEAQAPARGAPAPAAADPNDPLAARNAKPSSPAFADQPDKGKIEGFDFFRDPLNAKKPMQTFEETMKADVAMKQQVMDAQRKLLESRYVLEPKLDPEAKMSRSKPLAVGPTARLRGGLDWDKLGAMSAEQIKNANAFPYPSLPHPKHATGGQVSRKCR